MRKKSGEHMMFDFRSKILIVDDMSSMRKLLTKTLKEIGFTYLTEASDGVEAWQMISDAKPPFDLVISDLKMPNATGMDLLKRVRAYSPFKTLPFILLITEADERLVNKAIRAGASNYVVKPFQADSFKAKLEATYSKLNN